MNSVGSLLVEKDGSTLVVTPHRNLGSFAREEVQDECFDVLRKVDEPDVQSVVLDLGSIDYFGSMMLEFVVRIREKLQNKHGKLAICHLTPIGSEVFHAAHFDSHFAAAPTRTAAIELVSG